MFHWRDNDSYTIMNIDTLESMSHFKFSKLAESSFKVKNNVTSYIPQVWEQSI